MSQFQSDPAFVVQFRRRWGTDPATIKFLSELSEAELDRLSIALGERIVRRLPAALTAGLTCGERRDLARAFGRPLVRQRMRLPQAAAAEVGRITGTWVRPSRCAASTRPCPARIL